MATPESDAGQATPMGRPMARIGPNETIRMKMAKVRPSVSDDRRLELGEGIAAVLDGEAGDRRSGVFDVVGDGLHVALRDSSWGS